jgi:hypothetical protein
MKSILNLSSSKKSGTKSVRNHELYTKYENGMISMFEDLSKDKLEYELLKLGLNVFGRITDPNGMVSDVTLLASSSLKYSDMIPTFNRMLPYHATSFKMTAKCVKKDMYSEAKTHTLIPRDMETFIRLNGAINNGSALAGLNVVSMGIHKDYDCNMIIYMEDLKM